MNWKDANFLERRDFLNAFMAVLTGHVHRRGAAVGCESVPCHDCAASWPGEPAGFHLLARGLPGSLNDLLHVSSDDSLQSHGACSSRIIKMISSTRQTMIRCRINRATRRVSSRILVPINSNSWRDISSSPNALA